MREFLYGFICVRNSIFIVYVLLCVWVTTACTEYPEYPDIPHVSFMHAYTSISEEDKHIQFTFLLKDGDGDMGLGTADTSAPYKDSLYFNFHAAIRVTKNNTSYILPYGLQYRIPQIRSKDSNKFIKADVSIDISFARQLFPYDTLQLIYFVYDRALHKSNVDTSGVILF